MGPTECTTQAESGALSRLFPLAADPAELEARFGDTRLRKAVATNMLKAFVMNVTHAGLDLQKECLEKNPFADLSPNYRGLFHAGDPGVNPIIGGLIPF